MSNKNLIFFTSEFPYGSGETFIENEFPFLLQAFNKIIIVTNSNSFQACRISNHERVEVIYYPYELSFSDKIKSLSGIFSKIFWEEIGVVNKLYRLQINISILKTLLSSIQKMRNLSDFMEQLIKTKNLNPSELFIYSYWLNDMALGAAVINIRIPEIKTFSRAHGWDIYMDRQVSKYLPLRTFLFENLDACYTISENGRNYLLSNNIQYSDKIKVSHLGTFNATNINIISGKKYDKSSFTIVSCSNIIPLKRIDLIIEGLALLPQTKVNWVHFGSGTDELNIKQLANDKLKGLPNIQFEFKGQVNNKDLMNYYATMPVHLFMNVSESEGIPVSIMEAMSFGIPCLATDVGGTSEIVNNENGVLLSSYPEANEITNAILKFVNMNEAEYSNFSENAFKTWESNYNAEKNYKIFIDQILEL